MDEEDVVCPKPKLEERCKRDCVGLFKEAQKCAKRVEADETGEAHCTGQYFDYWKCIDKCVAKQLFKHTV